jgi:uncharacterized protein (TIGR02145 family)
MNFFTRKGRALLIIAAVLAVGAAGWMVGCGGDSGVADVTPVGGMFTDDRDGKSYKTVKIGGKTWMAENLNYHTPGETDSSWCYDNDNSNCETYGRLYDWETAMEACPAGWHLSSNAEWTALVTVAGGASVAGKKLKAKNGWGDYNGASGNGTDEFGFSALPGGNRFTDGRFGIDGTVMTGYRGYWWTDPQDGRGYMPIRSMAFHKGDVFEDRGLGGGASVRCVEHNGAGPSVGGKFTDDRDGKSYKTVKIGEQTWMAENLNYHKPGETDSSWCYGNYNSNCKTYGRLYDWGTAMQGASSSSANPSGVQGVCPVGWHLPSRAEWDTLVTIAGGTSVAGKKLKAINGWKDYNGASGNGTDEFGFSALPGGHRYSYGTVIDNDVYFSSAGDYGLWWTATEDTAGNAYVRYMHSGYDYVGSNDNGESYVRSVRCVSDF